MKLDEGAHTAEPEVQLPSATKSPAARLITRRREGVNGGFTASVTKAGLAAIEHLARNGANDAEIARQIGVARDTLRYIRQRDPEVEEAIARGRSQLDMEFVDRFVEWSRKGLWQPAIFFAKCRLGWREDGAPSPGFQIARADNVNIVLPPAMTPEQFAALLSPGDQQEKLIDVTP